MTMPRMRLLTLAALALAATSLGAKKEGRAPAPLPVLAAKVVAQPMPILVAAVGAVEPIESAAVSAQVTGLITQVAFTEGQEVGQGQLLFQIDPRPLAAALEAATAQLERDRAEAVNARVQADRYARLVERDFVTKEQAEEAATRAAALAAAVRTGAAAAEQARLNLAYASVKAPIAGRTGAILARRGNIARANDTLLVTINQLRPIRVSFAVAGDRLAEVRRRAAAGVLEVRVCADRSGEDAPLTGVLSFVDNAVDPATGTVTLKAEFANADEALWPGQFVDVELVLAVEPEALTVPDGAVLTGQDGQFVYVIKEGSQVEKRAVVVDRSLDGTTVLTGGVTAGETVVTDGQLRLAPGATVEIKPGLEPR